MATARQKKVAKKIIENARLDIPLTGGEIVESSGYGESMKLYPGRILESTGVKQALNDLGFSEEGAKKVVEEIMYSKETDASARLKATDQVFKVQGSYAPEKSVNMNLTVNASDPKAKQLAEEYEQKLKENL